MPASAAYQRSLLDRIDGFDARIDDGLDVAESLRRFTFNGAPTHEHVWSGVPFLVNEFWTARQRQAHRIHEISYRACFKPQLPSFFIERLTCPGDVVYDPFMGRGTTVIQAALMGRRPFGNDVNPLSTLLVRPRLNAPDLVSVARRLEAISWTYDAVIPEDLLVFFDPRTLREICALRAYLADRRSTDQLDSIDDWIQMVAVNRLTGHSSGFFSVYTLPPNQAVSVEAQKKINQKRAQHPEYRDVRRIILKKTRSLLGGEPFSSTEHLLTVRESSNTPEIAAGSVDLVVTSPPFLDVVQYADDNWLRCWFACIDVGAVSISMHRRPAAWQDFVRATFNELARVVRAGGHVAFEVGEVRNGKVELEKLVVEAVRDLPFTPLCVVVNDQAFTKTANCWGVSNNSAGTNSNRIVVFRRDEG